MDVVGGEGGSIRDDIIDGARDERREIFQVDISSGGYIYVSRRRVAVALRRPFFRTDTGDLVMH